MRRIVICCLGVFLLLSVFSGAASTKQSRHVSVAALSLPEGADGLLHLRDGDGATVPIQLSTRYFSEHIEVKGKIIRLYRDPINSETKTPLPEPLARVVIPPNNDILFMVLWSDSDGEEKEGPGWKKITFSGKSWKADSAKIFNFSSNDLGVLAGKKKILLPSGKTVDFLAKEWGSPFPVKIFRLETEKKAIFSSTWRVSKGRREVCFIGDVNGDLKFRALMERYTTSAQ